MLQATHEFPRELTVKPVWHWVQKLGDEHEAHPLMLQGMHVD